ncbi:MAG TPA: class I SAM-dependent methyltransferase [Bacteriovoracaceae bacterium]|nr:class I SAM-dependent methyltransferase [Bacteriovoracaceae bacterium]
MKGNTVAMESQALKNRILKNQKKLKSYLSKGQIEAYRIYHKDIPEYPYLIDIYGEHAVIYEQGKKLGDEDQVKRELHQKDITEVLEETLKIPSSKQHFKIREKQKGAEQYRPLEPNSLDYFVINEPPFKFWVNPERYLDTGLFLDHRPLRQFLLNNSMNKRVLNLFCYTGSLSVAAAMGGGNVTSIDMSATYIDWAIENFKLNDLDPKAHNFYRSDVLKELPIGKERGEKFDLILLDPPSFSNSKRMEEDLDIERDHALLIRDCMSLLSPEGTLFFSTNKRKFQLHNIVESQYKVKEISQWTIPQDFHHTDIHRAFSISRQENL